ncbi:MAG: electron transfer flavoprotein subunit beta/FixA family protein [Verrucomicrobia bacterium]|nr:electron transfer flavoprotein subunit beta/FixA family protein [Verrucomicrobiota bacterium]MDA1067088.1 electron transfer flavoprotein subunit beta/FixA family protein [Verrucomicrobiota bacterium]
MNILVCLKQILDPEVPVRDFAIDSSGLKANPACANQVTNIFCENALETALKLKDLGEGKITVLSFGPDSIEDTLRKGLAMKADEAFMVLNNSGQLPDSAVTAKVLAAAIRKMEPFDLILVGRESGDWGAGQTGGILAEELGLPFTAFVDEVSQDGTDQLIFRQQTDSGWQKFSSPKPSVASITNSDHNLPRIPKTRDIIMANRKEVTSWSLEDVGMSSEELSANHLKARVRQLSIPEQKSNCEFIEGDSMEEKIQKLAHKIAAIARSV